MDRFRFAASEGAIMRKDESKVREYAKHTRNAGGYGKRGANKRVRKNVKRAICKEPE